VTDPIERRRLSPDVELVMQAIQSRDDAITALRGDVQEMPWRIGQAVQEANMRTVSDPAFWAAAVAALRREARDQAGGFLWDGIRNALRWFTWFVLVGVGVYLIGGWSALVALFKGGLPPHS
jgi:hypothetical protein